MGKPKETIIKNFSGGMSDYLRQQKYNAGYLIKHFDIFSNPKKLIPYRDTETDIHDGIGATGMKARDARHFQLGLNGKLYALCKNASGYPEICSKADPTTGNWAVEATSVGNAARKTGCFVEWQGAWWMFSGTTNVSKWVIGGSFTNKVAVDAGDALGESITTVAHAVIGADDNLYMFYNDRVVRITPAGVVSDNVCTALPSDMRITSVCRYGTYLAIGMAYGTSATATPSGRSQVFIWDMVTDTTVSDVLDWGEGALTVLGEVEGRLIGVSNVYLEKSTADDDLSMGKGAMVIKSWSGGIVRTEKEIVANQAVTLGRFIKDVVIKDNRIYWVASVPFGTSTATESTFHLGIWSFGRKNKDSEFALSLDYIEDGVDASNFKIVSFGSAGNYWFINHSADGSISKTSDTATYTTTSVYESQLFGDGDNSKLVGVCVKTDPMPADGQIILKYMKDEETAWTTIFTNTTDNSISHKALNIESSGVELPDFREIRFRIESTGGAEPTVLFFFDEPKDDDIF